MNVNFKKLKESNPGKYPEKLGEKWTPEEETQMLKLFREGNSFKEIAEIHKRMIGGVRSRMNQIIERCYKSGWSVDRIHNLTGMDKPEINLIIEKIEKRTQKVSFMVDVSTQTETHIHIHKMKRD